MKKHLYLFAIACLSFLCVHAAKNQVVFRTATGTYTELTGATPVMSAIMAYDSFLVSSLSGESFALFDKSITLQPYSIMILRNGRIQITEDTSFTLADALYAEDLDSIDNTSSISYKIEGAGNKKILKVEWKNLRINKGAAINFINVQTWLYQETGIIEYHYGPRSANNATGYNTPATGIYIGLWYSNYDFSRRYEKMQVTGNMPNFSIDSALTMSVPYADGVPAEGTVFRFVPKKAATGIVKLLEHIDISVYPNPASNELSVMLPAVSEPVAVILTDMQGRVVYSTTPGVASNKLIIPTGGMQAGAYMLQVIVGRRCYDRAVAIQH